MTAHLGLIAAFSVPLMILNMLGGVVSGIWLVFLGEWGAVGRGALLFCTSTFLLSFALMPSILFTTPALYYAERGKTFGLVFFSALSNLYILALVMGWCYVILSHFMKDATESSLIPRLIWSYGVATGPWAYMASKDQGPAGEGSTSALTVFFAEVAYLLIMLLVVFTPISLLGAIKVFGSFMLAGWVAQMIIVISVQRNQ